MDLGNASRNDDADDALLGNLNPSIVCAAICASLTMSGRFKPSAFASSTGANGQSETGVRRSSVLRQFRRWDRSRGRRREQALGLLEPDLEKPELGDLIDPLALRLEELESGG